MPPTGISSTDDPSQILDTGHDHNDDDVESDHHSCVSCISDDGHSEEGMDQDGTYLGEEDEVFEWDCNDEVWVPVKSSDVQDLFGASMRSKGWIRETEHLRWFDALLDVREIGLDAVGVLAETVGGAATDYWHLLLSNQEKYGNRVAFYGGPLLLILIMSSTRPWTDTDWWESHTLYIPSRKMYHYSFASSLFEGRLLIDHSLDKPQKNLAEVMQIALPYFREMKTRVEALSKLHNVGYSSSSSCSASIFGPRNMGNILTCLYVAESVAKLVPVLGCVLEGACGVLRKIVEAAKDARAARDECTALAEHTACITLAILNEVVSTSNGHAILTSNIFDLCATIGEVERQITKLAALGHMKYFVSRGKINADVKELRTRVDNARIAFKIRNDISTSGLLHDLRIMQKHLVSRVEDLFEGQKAIQSKLDMLLVQVRRIVILFVMSILKPTRHTGGKSQLMFF